MQSGSLIRADNGELDRNILDPLHFKMQTLSVNNSSLLYPLVSRKKIQWKTGKIPKDMCTLRYEVKVSMSTLCISLFSHLYSCHRQIKCKPFQPLCRVNAILRFSVAYWQEAIQWMIRWNNRNEKKTRFRSKNSIANNSHFYLLFSHSPSQSKLPISHWCEKKKKEWKKNLKTIERRFLFLQPVLS